MLSDKHDELSAEAKWDAVVLGSAQMEQFAQSVQTLLALEHVIDLPGNVAQGFSGELSWQRY